MDSDYWKRAYQNTWSASSAREDRLARWLERITGRKAERSGLGAGTDDFISGSAKANGYSMGDADLHIVGTDIYVEVTGPLSKFVSADKPLWFRPDKFDNAVENAGKGHDTFFVHHCPAKDLWRVVHIDRETAQRYLHRAFPVVTPTIRGRKERYVEVQANDRCVRPLSYLRRYLQEHLPPPGAQDGGRCE